MSTKPTPSASDLELPTPTESFTASNAPRTFDPFNTRPCPEMFADKWTADDDPSTPH